MSGDAATTGLPSWTNIFGLGTLQNPREAYAYLGDIASLLCQASSAELCYEAALLHLWRMDLAAAAAAAARARVLGKDTLHLSALLSAGGSESKQAADAQATALLAEGWLPTVMCWKPLFVC
ncbi:hypothetical protein WJX74_003450 [Apatococcus lobatus]|uniref:Uncharacterized protein n=1 Tax=Apatococcus lobatus TaxID=904363 RepID=A0AAW1RY97_9CHLO